jgi:hypothetical protein
VDGTNIIWSTKMEEGKDNLNDIQRRLHGDGGEGLIYYPKIVVVSLTPEEAKDLSLASGRAFRQLRQVFEEHKQNYPPEPDAADYVPQIEENPYSSLVRVDRTRARARLITMLSVSRITHSQIRSLHDSEELADAIMNLIQQNAPEVQENQDFFGWVSSFFSPTESVQWYINYHELLGDFFASYKPVSSASLDACLLGISGSQAVLFFTFEED